jgi:histone acetyltransferase 1
MTFANGTPVVTPISSGVVTYKRKKSFLLNNLRRKKRRKDEKAFLWMPVNVTSVDPAALPDADSVEDAAGGRSPSPGATLWPVLRHRPVPSKPRGKFRIKRGVYKQGVRRTSPRKRQQSPRKQGQKRHQDFVDQKIELSRSVTPTQPASGERPTLERKRSVSNKRMQLYTIFSHSALKFRIIGGTPGRMNSPSATPSPHVRGRQGSFTQSSSPFSVSLGHFDKDSGGSFSLGGGREPSSPSELEHALSPDPAIFDNVLPRYSTQNEFKPVYTHQMFSDTIYGYRDLKVVMTFTPGGLRAHASCTYVSRVEDCDEDPAQVLLQYIPDCTRNPCEFAEWMAEDARWEPPGRKIHEYSLDGKGRGGGGGGYLDSDEVVTYEIYIASLSDDRMRRFHRQLQFFILFYIDRSSFIDDKDDIWEVVLLVEKRVSRAQADSTPVVNLPGSGKGGKKGSKSPRNRTPKPAQKKTTYATVGYCTLYKFHSYASCDWRLRVSQILILPPYQRHGHGQRILSRVYDIAQERDYKEINVEDPAPAFQFIRDFTDMQRCKAKGYYQFSDAKSGGLKDKQRLRDRLTWDEGFARVVADDLRITMTQVRRCYELFRLGSLAGASEHDVTKFRLDVKNRLWNKHKAELAVLGPSLPRKSRLHQLYLKLEASYQLLIRKTRRGRR